MHEVGGVSHFHQCLTVIKSALFADTLSFAVQTWKSSLWTIDRKCAYMVRAMPDMSVVISVKRASVKMSRRHIIQNRINSLFRLVK